MAGTKPWSRVMAELYALFSRNPKTNRLIVEVADLSSELTTLDIGCGPGAAVRLAAPVVAKAVGVDNSAAMLGVAARRSKEHGNVEYHEGSAEALPFPDNSFDRAWTVQAFHHWSDQAAGIVEAQRVLRPGGKFLVMETEGKGKHAMSGTKADEVVEGLVAAGFSSATIDKRGKYLVITAEA